MSISLSGGLGLTRSTYGFTAQEADQELGLAFTSVDPLLRGYDHGGLARAFAAPQHETGRWKHEIFAVSWAQILTTHTFTKTYVDGNRFVGQDLVFKQKGQVMLRSGFIAERSNIVLDKMVTLLCVDAIFRGCQITSRAIRGSKAERAQFIDCTFHGTFIDWKFGGRGVSPAVVGCDFTDAELSDCDFQCCKVREQAFAGWPTVVFDQPFEHRAALRAAPWPRTAKAMAWVQNLTEIECDGVVIHGEKAARWMGVKPKALREAIEAIESEAIVKLI